jgi:hypothetical protein
MKINQKIKVMELPENYDNNIFRYFEYEKAIIVDIQNDDVKLKFINPNCEKINIENKCIFNIKYFKELDDKEDLKFPKNSIVLYDYDDKEFERIYNVKKGDMFLCLGEINNMPGHGIYATPTGKIIWGWHNDRFRLPKNNEI